MGQNIADRTHQNAHCSRTRRASVVKEVAQSEHENVSTRVLANYNHMHALTVQYYEVVQVHRVDLTLAKAERVVFIPVKLLDFTDERLDPVDSAGVLARAALTFAIRDALANLDVIELTPAVKQQFVGLGRTLQEYVEFANSGPGHQCRDGPFARRHGHGGRRRRSAKTNKAMANDDASSEDAAKAEVVGLSLVRRPRGGMPAVPQVESRGV